MSCLSESICEDVFQHTAHLWLLLTGITDVGYYNPAVNSTFQRSSCPTFPMMADVLEYIPFYYT